MGFVVVSIGVTGQHQLRAQKGQRGKQSAGWSDGQPGLHRANLTAIAENSIGRKPPNAPDAHDSARCKRLPNPRG